MTCSLISRYHHFEWAFLVVMVLVWIMLETIMDELGGLMSWVCIGGDLNVIHFPSAR